MTEEKNSHNKKLFNRHQVYRVVYIAVIVVCIVVFSWTGYAASYVYPLLWGDLSDRDVDVETPSEEELLSGQMTIVLLGTDKRKNETAGRSDTLMVAFVDIDNKKIRLLSIPRDTYIEIPGYGHTKINHGYAYGGIKLTLQTLEENFGIKADYYAQIDFKGFRQVIDAVGGVVIDVPKRMVLAKESIDLQPGLQRLSGDQALQFVRYRDGEGDIGRVGRQQMFMEALTDQVASVGTMVRIPDICQAIIDNITTNMAGAQLLKLAISLGSDVSLETYQPAGDDRYGSDGISYFYIDPAIEEDFFSALVNYEDSVPGNAERRGTGETTQEEIEANPDG